MKTRKRIYSSKNYMESVNMMEVLKNIPKDINWNDILLIPVFILKENSELSEMVGFKFVVYEEVDDVNSSKLIP